MVILVLLMKDCCKTPVSLSVVENEFESTIVFYNPFSTTLELTIWFELMFYFD